MARISPLKKEEAQGEIKEMFEVIDKQFEMIPNLFVTIARYPALAGEIGNFYCGFGYGRRRLIKR